MNLDPATVWTAVFNGDPALITVNHTPEQGLVYADMLAEWDHVETWRGTTVLPELYHDDWAECPEGHGPQRITDQGSNPGFTGMPIYWADLACGHQWWDASLDGPEAV